MESWNLQLIKLLRSVVDPDQDQNWIRIKLLYGSGSTELNIGEKDADWMIKMHNFYFRTFFMYDYFCKVCFFKDVFFNWYYSITVWKGSDPDQNWGKLQDPDPNTLSLWSTTLPRRISVQLSALNTWGGIFSHNKMEFILLNAI